VLEKSSASIATETLVHILSLGFHHFPTACALYSYLHIHFGCSVAALFILLILIRSLFWERTWHLCCISVSNLMDTRKVNTNFH